MIRALEVHVSVPDKETGDRLLSILLEKKAAACVQMLGPIHSTYLWKGKVESAREHLLLIKTLESVYPRLEALVVEHHPYDIPEILAFPAQYISDSYAEWMAHELQS